MSRYADVRVSMCVRVCVYADLPRYPVITDTMPPLTGSREMQEWTFT